MSVKTDLIAARALIDTPEKLAAMEFGVLGALSDVCPEEDGVTDVDARFTEMRDALIGLRYGTLISINREPHPDILALFDREISTAEDAP